MTTIIFDTETTGLVKNIALPLDQQPKMIEFAGIKLDDDLKECGRLEFFVDPQQELPKIITKITNITDDMVRGQGTFPTHLPKLQEFFLGCRTMVAHNLPFDLNIVLFELQRMDAATRFPWPMNHFCTASGTYHLNNYRMKMIQLYEYCFKEKFAGAHRAMNDTEALARCYVWLKENNKI